MEALLMFGALTLVGVGVWTVNHPNGGYRAAGGVGSGFSPETRRRAGWMLIVVALTVMAMVAFGGA